MTRARRIAGMLALVVVMGACTEQETVDSAAQDALQAADTQLAADTTGFLDPNDATREELVAAGLDPAEVEAVIANRPYATMTRVDSVLELDSATAERVYARIWMPI